MAGPAAAAGWMRQFAVFLHLGVCRQRSADQPGASGGSGLLDREQSGALPDGESPVDFDSVRATNFHCCGSRDQLLASRRTAICARGTTTFAATMTGGWRTTLCSASCASVSPSRRGTRGPPKSPSRDPATLAKLRAELQQELDRGALPAVRILRAVVQLRPTVPSAAFA